MSQTSGLLVMLRQYERLRSDTALLRWVLWAFRAKGLNTLDISELRRIPEPIVARLLQDAKRLPTT